MKHPEEIFGIEATPSKESVVAALKKHSKCLANIHLPQPATPLAQALKDFRRERVLFNEVPFIPDKADSDRNIGFALTLSEYVRRIHQIYPSGVDNGLYRKDRGRSLSQFEEFSDTSSTRQKDRESIQSKDELLDLDKMSSAELILQRACRSSAGTDSFFMVQKLFATEGTLVTQRSNILGFVPFVNGEPPVIIDLFLEEESTSEEASSSSGEKNNNDEKATSAKGGSGLQEQRTNTAAETSETTLNEGVPDSSSNNSSNNKNDSSCSSVLEAVENSAAAASASASATKEDESAAAKDATSSPHLIGEICISNSFAVYDVDTVDLISGDPDTDPPPWLEVETIITDHCNFTTGEQKRVLEVQVYIPAENAYFPPLESGSSPSASVRIRR